MSKQIGWYHEVVRECYNFGATLRTGCSKQRPSNYGKCQVRTTTRDKEDGRITILEPPMSCGEAIAWVNRVLSNYPLNEYSVETRERFMDKGVEIYHRAIIMNYTRTKRVCVLEIINLK